MIRDQVQSTIHEISLLREAVSLFAENEGWYEHDIEYVTDMLNNMSEWLCTLVPNETGGKEEYE